MKEKFFYLPGYHAVAYCHQDEGDSIVIGDICEFVNDAKNNFGRQKISKESFAKLRPLELDADNFLSCYSIELYKFPITGSEALRVRGGSNKFYYRCLRGAERLPYERSSYQNHYLNDTGNEGHYNPYDPIWAVQ